MLGLLDGTTRQHNNHQGASNPRPGHGPILPAREVAEHAAHEMIQFGESSLRRAVAEYVEHYHAERAHQGLGNERIEGGAVAAVGEVRCRKRLGGILKSYHRAA